MDASYLAQEVLKHRRFSGPRIKYFCGRELQWVQESETKNKREKLEWAEFRLKEPGKRFQVASSNLQP